MPLVLGGVLVEEEEDDDDERRLLRRRVPSGSWARQRGPIWPSGLMSRTMDETRSQCAFPRLLGTAGTAWCWPEGAHDTGYAIRARELCE